jgi:hypothetical protein
MFGREFISGFAGSFGFLLLCVINQYEQRDDLPSYYYKKPYWCARIGFALIAGCLPALLDLQNSAQAFAAGICAPIIFQTLWEKALGTNHHEPTNESHRLIGKGK